MKRFLWILFVAALLLPGCKKQSNEVVEIRWFVGIGAGSDAPLLEPQQKVVDAFNASHPNIKLKLEIVANVNAANTLATQFTAGNPPDIVGPSGQLGRNTFRGSWLDMSELIDDADVDLDVYEESLVKAFTTKEEGQVGLPFAVYPSCLYVNKDMFAEAKIPLPPQKYNEKYTTADGKQVDWDMNAMIDIAKKLTVDKNGNVSGSEKFNIDKIDRFGWGFQFAQLDEYCTLFGPGSYHDKNNKPMIPDHWRKAAKLYHDGMWKDVWTPNGIYDNAPAPFPGGEFFASGKVAMVQTHLWYTGFMEPNFKNWDFYATPSYNGKITCPLDSDTFFITKACKHPKEAFEVYQYLVKDALPQLAVIYGGLPAIPSMQDDFLKSISERFPTQKLTFQVVKDSLKYVDIPGYEGWEPNGVEVDNHLTAFWNNFKRTKDFDVDKELDKLIVELTPVMAAAKK